MQTQPIKTTFVRVYGCDKCGHRWTPKKIDSLSGKFSLEEQDAFLSKNFPKICPKCKSPRWNEQGKKPGKQHDKKTLALVAKKYGQETADMLRAEHDTAFHKKMILAEMEKVKGEMDSAKRLYETSTEYYKDLQKELEAIKEKS